MGFSYNVNVLNQKGSPALYTDTFANRPNFGYAGRLFIANDTSAIYEDTGTAWVLIANVSSGAGTLQQVTTNGNTSNVGISITAGGLSTNSVTNTSLTLGSVLFTGAAGLVTQNNPSFFWDNTNNRLGINTTTPGNSLDVQGSGTNPILSLNNTAGNQSAIVFSNTGTNKWRIGNSGTNTFDFYNSVLALIAFTINGANNGVTFNQNLKIKQGASFYPESGLNSIGTDAGGFFFQLDTKTFSTYFNFNGLTVARSFTFPDATGTIALTSNLSSYLPLTGGTLSGALTVNVGGGLPALNIGNSSLSSKTWTLIPTTNGVDSDLVFYYTGTSSGTKVTFGNTGTVTFTGALNGTNAVLTGTIIASDHIIQPSGYSVLASLSKNLTGSGYGVLTLRNGANGTILPSTLTVDRTYTLPDATGTLALTSNLSSYLPLSGGTLSGSLTGTSATFSSDLNVGNTVIGGTLEVFGSARFDSTLNDGFHFYTLPSLTGTLALTSDLNGYLRLSGGTLSGALNGTSASFSSSLSTTGASTVTFSSLVGTGSRTVLASATGVLSAPVSDINVKENIQPLKYGLDAIMQLNPVSFEYIESYKDYGDGLQVGNIAQDVEKVIPEAVFVTPLTGLKGINYNQFDGIYIKAIQDLNNIIENQNTLIQSLINRIELLENK